MARPAKYLSNEKLEIIRLYDARDNFRGNDYTSYWSIDGKTIFSEKGLILEIFEISRQTISNWKKELKN